MNCINMEFRFEFDFKNKGFTENAPFARTFSVCADIFGLRGHFRFARTFSVCADIFGLRGHFRFARTFSVRAEIFGLRSLFYYLLFIFSFI